MVSSTDSILTRKIVNETYSGMMYYVFLEAMNGNASAPIIVWLQGGPGASSMCG